MGAVSASLDLYSITRSAEASEKPFSTGREGSFSTEVLERICADPWALRHRLVNKASGVSVPMQCHRYDCLHCGPLKVGMWRDLLELAAPERFITLSRVGSTLEEVGRVATVVVKRLRRHGYRFEYLMTFEQHKSKANGFHIHMLQKGDYIPQGVLSEGLLSATHGRSWVVDIRRAEPSTAGYVTKYVTKSLAGADIGLRADGTRARPQRVRYSKRFFDAPASELRQLVRDRARATIEAAGEPSERLEGEWVLIETDPLPRDYRGRVDQLAAERLRDQLITGRLEEAGTTARHVRGGLLVLRYMLGSAADAAGDA